MLDSIVAAYKNSYNASAPLLQTTETAAATLLGQQTAWASVVNDPHFSAYTLGTSLVVSWSGTGSIQVPLTAADWDEARIPHLRLGLRPHGTGQVAQNSSSTRSSRREPPAWSAR